MCSELTEFTDQVAVKKSKTSKQLSIQPKLRKKGQIFSEKMMRGQANSYSTHIIDLGLYSFSYFCISRVEINKLFINGKVF